MLSVFALSAAGASGCAGRQGAGRSASPPGAPARAAAPAAAQPAPPWLREIQAEVETLRERPFLRAVPYAAQTRDSFHDYVRGELAHELPAQKSADESRALVALGFVPEGFQLRDAMEQAMVTQVAAYYDTAEVLGFLVEAVEPPSQMPATDFIL